MKFRNFDKIGLTTKNGIKAFLGDIWVRQLQEKEDFNRVKLEKKIKENKINTNINFDNTICLINKCDSYEKVLICIIKPALKCLEDNSLSGCYYLQADNRISVTDFNLTFDDEETALKKADSLYGLQNYEEISEKLRGENQAE